MNYKGYAGDKGLESYKAFEAYNLGAQVENEQLAERALALSADAILVSQIITQRNCHKENALALIELAKKQGWRSKVVMLLGGPRIDHKLALELGFDAGFGPGTKPSVVASFLVEWMCGDREQAGAAMAIAGGAAASSRTRGARRGGAAGHRACPPAGDPAGGLSRPSSLRREPGAGARRTRRTRTRGRPRGPAR